MASLKERVLARVEQVRERRPFVDHLVRMQVHYGAVKASQQAGAITYFGFLSFFPILALAFFLVGYLARIYPGIEADLVQGIQQVLPGLVGNGEGEISLEQVQSAAGAVGLVGLAGVLYAGLGWLSSMRDALVVVFEEPSTEQPNFVFGKLRDLLTLALVGAVLVLSVGVSGVVTTFSTALLDLVGLDEALAPLVSGLSVLLGLAASAVLFLALFTLLARPSTPRRSLWQGALLGAVGFEVLKQLSRLLLASTKDQPAFQAFGIALILVVWINYFSRLMMYAAAFAHTSRAARALREGQQGRAVATPESVSASAMAAYGAPSGVDLPGPARARQPEGWMGGFVDRIDAADPDDVGPASAQAVRRAREQQQQRESGARLLALGAAGSAAGVAAFAIVRRHRR
ncbi:MAG: YihY/virulence factor BrkB family protein [Nocardioides sp.]|nr:YihY/virulence factor BrkB family protein [Nocardioides sp.]